MRSPQSLLTLHIVYLPGSARIEPLRSVYQHSPELLRAPWASSNYLNTTMFVVLFVFCTVELDLTDCIEAIEIKSKFTIQEARTVPAPLVLLVDVDELT